MLSPAEFRFFVDVLISFIAFSCVGWHLVYLWGELRGR